MSRTRASSKTSPKSVRFSANFEEVVFDEKTGIARPDFWFQFVQKSGKKKGAPVCVIPENCEQLDDTKLAFVQSAKIKQENKKEVAHRSVVAVAKEQ